jgi:hypothetical protein
MIPHIPDNSNSDDDWRRRVKTAVNALSSLLTQNGLTATRPIKAVTGQMFYDTTLGKPIWYHSTGVWKDASGATV